MGQPNIELVLKQDLFNLFDAIIVHVLVKILA